MIKIKGIDHICILVNNFKRFKDYYEKLFGFEFKPHPHSKNIWAVESENVHFFVKETSEKISEQHLSLLVDDINEIIKVLKQEKIQYETGTFKEFKFNNYNWVEWKDSEGIRLECIDKNV